LIDYNGMKEVTLKATLGNDYSSSLIDCVYDLTIGSLHKKFASVFCSDCLCHLPFFGYLLLLDHVTANEK